MSKYINKNRKTVTTPKNKSVFSSVNLSSYNIPEIIESKSKEYVEFGADNNYFKFLINRANGSATSGACITGIAQMIYGKGLDATDSSRKPESYARMISLFKKEQVRRLAYDLKLTGQCAIQIIYSKDKKTIQKVEHLPIETLRAEKCAPDDKEVQAYYYFADWSEIKPSDEPLRIPSFGLTDTPAAIEIMYVKPYEAGLFYYSTPDYISGISFSQIEEEISNFHVNNIQNAFAPSALINFNNGVPDEATQRLIEQKFTSKFSGSSNSGKLMMAFNDSKESQADITPIQISDAHNQYEFISKEAQSKIMMSHRIVSPMLLGIKDSTGFGNNAEELKNASILMQNIVINPFQETLTDAFDKILAYNGIALNLYFKTLQPLQFIDLENVKDKETREEETGVKMSKENSNFNDDEMLDSLDGEEITDEWELVEKREYSEDNKDLEDWAEGLIKETKTGLQKLATFIKSKPNGESKLDKSFYKVRYEYAEKYSSNNSRKFCKTMMARTGKGVVYRKEDIDQASFSGVNKSFGHKGQNYSLFRFKGGRNCGHFFNENLYRLKSKTEKYISRGKEVDNIPSTYTPKGKQYKDAKIAPKDMKNGGAYPTKKK
mgnify:FL=1|tara:strand:+ start:762 stop:2576 length:1815 start_codon:yes stop_codon:yes gene_type:complete